MSAAGSRQWLESPSGDHADFNEIPEQQEQAEKAALEKLISLYLPSCSSRPVIAVDLDDVLSQTNQMVADYLKAVLLIDDSVENALQCATHKEPTQVLLFGNYEWNKRASGPQDEMSFDRRLEIEGGKEFWKDEIVAIPEGAPLTRTKDWNEVVRWVQNAKLSRPPKV
ncbi:hypothetical protein C0989_000853 [Termitomyces sp. Mn162]|nr:hypothetical protein C0989_000853 [Termitomyces sp. Mn162]